VLFGTDAKNAGEFDSKGDLVQVFGIVKYRQYKSSKTGELICKPEIIVDDYFNISAFNKAAKNTVTEVAHVEA